MRERVFIFVMMFALIGGVSILFIVAQNAQQNSTLQRNDGTDFSAPSTTSNIQTETDYRTQVGECAYNYLVNTGKLETKCGGVVQHSGMSIAAKDSPLIHGKDFNDDCVNFALFIRDSIGGIACISQ